MDVNLAGQFYCSNFALPALKETGGTILNMSSVQGSVAARCPAYSASKAATLNLTRDLAAAYGQDSVTVNAICPGTIRTPNLNHLSEEEYAEMLDLVEQGDEQTVLPRLGTPKDIGQVAAFLSSEKAEWITGEAIPLTGVIQPI